VARSAELSRSFTVLGHLADRITAQANAQVDSEVAALEEQTLESRRRLLWQSGLLVPLTIVLIFALTFAVGRPLRQLDRAISELGEGTFSNQIAVSGPHDLERLGGQLEWLRQRLLDLAHERNRFLRHMSHELKTPLANIREGTELLMDGAVGELDSSQREVAGILRDNGIKLQRMIENLLSFSAWQTSSVGLEPTEFRLRPVVKQVLENQQLTLLSQRVRLDVKVADITLVADGFPLEVDTPVEVRSRFHDRWICGFAVAEAIDGGRGPRRYRLTRRSDGIPLPLLFDAHDVRAASLYERQPAAD